MSSSQIYRGISPNYLAKLQSKAISLFFNWWVSFWHDKSRMQQLQAAPKSHRRWQAIQEVSVGLAATEAPAVAGPDEQRMETMWYHLSPDWSLPIIEGGFSGGVTDNPSLSWSSDPVSPPPPSGGLELSSEFDFSNTYFSHFIRCIWELNAIYLTLPLVHLKVSGCYSCCYSCPSAAVQIIPSHSCDQQQQHQQSFDASQKKHNIKK